MRLCVKIRLFDALPLADMSFVSTHLTLSVIFSNFLLIRTVYVKRIYWIKLLHLSDSKTESCVAFISTRKCKINVNVKILCIIYYAALREHGSVDLMLLRSSRYLHFFIVHLFNLSILVDRFLLYSVEHLFIVKLY